MSFNATVAARYVWLRAITEVNGGPLNSVAQFSVNVGGTTHPLTINPIGSGTGTVTSAPAGIDCGSTCVASYDQGTTVTLTANPAAGSTFASWSGGGCTGNGAFVVTMTEMETVTATFDVALSAFPPPISTPAPGSTLTSTTVTFTGLDSGQPDEQHWLSVEMGSFFGNCIFCESLGTGVIAKVSGLPSSGNLYVRYLSYTLATGWVNQYYTYTMNVP